MPFPSARKLSVFCNSQNKVSATNYREAQPFLAMMGEPIYQGTCLCEGVKFTVQGKPENIFACYCTDCQKNAGGPVQMVELLNGPI
jgi:hypothetical protein